MSITGDNHEERITKLEAARQLMEDSLLVHANLEARASTRLAQHESFLEAHEGAMGSLAKAQRGITSTLEEMADSMKAIDDRRIAHEEKLLAWEVVHAEFRRQHEIATREFDDKLNALIKIVGFMQGGMETRPNG